MSIEISSLCLGGYLAQQTKIIHSRKIIESL